jgi:FHA domain
MNTRGMSSQQWRTVEVGLGALEVLALFAPWFGVSLFGGTLSASVIQAVPGDGVGDMFALAALGALAACGYRAYRPAAERWVGWAAVACYGAAILLTVWILVQLVQGQSQPSYLGLAMQLVQPSWGVGLYAVAATAGAVLVGLDLRNTREAGAVPGVAFGVLRAGSGAPATGAGPSHAVSAHIGVVESGRALGSFVAQPGDSLLVGRDPDAQVRLTDGRASRRHAVIERDETGWLVRDLGATNPTQLLDASGARRQLHNSAVHLDSGQLLIGDALITLFPGGQA